MSQSQPQTLKKGTEITKERAEVLLGYRWCFGTRRQVGPETVQEIAGCDPLYPRFVEASKGVRAGWLRPRRSRAGSSTVFHTRGRNGPNQVRLKKFLFPS